MIRHPCPNFKVFFLFQIKTLNTHGWVKQEIMLRLCCKERLDKVVNYEKCKDIGTLPETRYAPTHTLVNNHRLLSLPLRGVILNYRSQNPPHNACTPCMWWSFGNLIRMCEMWSSAIEDRAFWHHIKSLHSYSAFRACRNRKVCATSCRCAFDLIASNHVNLYHKRHLDSNTVGYRYNAVQNIMVLQTVVQWQQ